jgi:hypothetical protein
MRRVYSLNSFQALGVDFLIMALPIQITCSDGWWAPAWSTDSGKRTGSAASNICTTTSANSVTRLSQLATLLQAVRTPQATKRSMSCGSGCPISLGTERVIFLQQLKPRHCPGLFVEAARQPLLTKKQVWSPIPRQLPVAPMMILPERSNSRAGIAVQCSQNIEAPNAPRPRQVVPSRPVSTFLCQPRLDDRPLQLPSLPHAGRA